MVTLSRPPGQKWLSYQVFPSSVSHVGMFPVMITKGSWSCLFAFAVNLLLINSLVGIISLHIAFCKKKKKKKVYYVVKHEDYVSDRLLYPQIRQEKPQEQDVSPERGKQSKRKRAGATSGMKEQRPKDRLDPKALSTCWALYGPWASCGTAGKVTAKCSFRCFSASLFWLLEMHAPLSPVNHSP